MHDIYHDGAEAYKKHLVLDTGREFLNNYSWIL